MATKHIRVQMRGEWVPRDRFSSAFRKQARDNSRAETENLDKPPGPQCVVDFFS